SNCWSARADKEHRRTVSSRGCRTISIPLSSPINDLRPAWPEVRSSDAVPAAILLAWPVRRQAVAQSISVGATAASADGAALRPSAIENLKRERDRLIPLVPPPKYRLNSVRGSHHTLPDRPCSTASRISRRLCKLRRIRPRKAGQPISGQALRARLEIQTASFFRAILRIRRKARANWSHASEDSIVASKSFDRRRARLIQPRVLSTTHLLGKTMKPLTVVSVRLTTVMVIRLAS